MKTLSRPLDPEALDLAAWRGEASPARSTPNRNFHHLHDATRPTATPQLHGVADHAGSEPRAQAAYRGEDITSSCPDGLEIAAFARTAPAIEGFAAERGADLVAAIPR